jgi:phosphoglycerate dehydrogenase-like enzyme
VSAPGARDSATPRAGGSATPRAGGSATPRAGALAAVAPDALQAVRAHAPEQVRVVSLQEPVDLQQVDFLVPPAGERSLLGALPGLRRLAVVQVLSAGVDWVERHVPEQALLCSARGARDEPVAEWVLGALLGASSGLLRCARERRWERRELEDLASWRVLIVGMGSIGLTLAARLRALGVEVVGVASRAREGLHAPEELPALVPDADAVVLLMPLTDATRGLIGARELAAMRDGALIVNAARGPVIDTEALLAHTASGRLRAVLDVTDPEPLPPEHPLWQAPGVLSITPHIAGDSPLGHARAAELAGRQLARWWAGEPLENVVRRGPRG